MVDMGKTVKALTSGLIRENAVRLSGWGPRDPPREWLEIIDDMVPCRS